jgi:hypothetical protein
LVLKIKRFRRVFFVLFYVAVSIGVTGYRSARMADRVEHARGRSTPLLEAPCQGSIQGLPYFSHSQTGSRNAAASPATGAVFSYLVLGKLEDGHVILHISPLEFDPTNPRAPPNA